jgi:hypothetical protein
LSGTFFFRFSTADKDGWEFLTSFPALSKAYSGSEEKEECQKLYDGGLATLLAAGTKNGQKLVNFSLSPFFVAQPIRFAQGL